MTQPKGPLSLVDDCSVRQVGDREFWCSSHKRDASVCADMAESPQGVTYQEALLEGADFDAPAYDFEGEL